MLGTVIRKYRHARDMKQQTLADKIGVTQAYISTLEAGKKHVNVTIAVLNHIAAVLGAPIEELAQAAAADATAQAEESRATVEVATAAPPLVELQALDWPEDQVTRIMENWPYYSGQERLTILTVVRELQQGQEDLERRRRVQQEALNGLLGRRTPAT